MKTPHPLTDAASMAANYSNEGGVGYNRYQKKIMGMWMVNRLRDELCPGLKKLNLHASYAIFEDSEWTDRDKLEPKHFQKWVDFCKERGVGCDFNPTFFSHPKCDPLTLSSPDEETRRFWIGHGKACVRISQYLAQELGQPCVMNIWTGEGFTDIPGDRMAPGCATGKPSTRFCPSPTTSPW